MKHGDKYRVNLVDGSTLEGRLAWSWGWWSYRLVEVTAENQVGDSVEADGFFIVPRRSILHIQAVTE